MGQLLAQRTRWFSPAALLLLWLFCAVVAVCSPAIAIEEAHGWRKMRVWREVRRGSAVRNRLRPPFARITLMMTKVDA